MTDQTDGTSEVARVRTMPLAALLTDYQDGNQRGWAHEVALVWRHNPAAMTALCDDIAANGMRRPIHLGEDGRIWDGHHRIAAALALDLGTVPVTDDWEAAALGEFPGRVDTTESKETGPKLTVPAPNVSAVVEPTHPAAGPTHRVTLPGGAW
jgi:hypothetical protein